MKQTVAISVDRDYDEFLRKVQTRFIERTSQGKEPLFEAAGGDLFATYLSGIPENRRQHHTCHACRRFVDNFGGLVTIGSDGIVQSALWSVEDASEELRGAVQAVLNKIHQSRVEGVFITKEDILGTPTTGVWNHLSICVPTVMRAKSLLLSAFQMSAEKTEDAKTVSLALSEYDQKVLEQAVKLLKSDSLYRSEKVLGQAEWLLQLKESTNKLKGVRRTNLIWKAVATAPTGFCHPRSSMIGTLLENIKAGHGYESAARRFAAKMHPLQYQRPTAEPTAGAIAEAEKVVDKLKVEGALARRFCRVEEVQALWRPKAVEQTPPGKGVFGHLKAKSTTPEVVNMLMPPIRITWSKFRKTVLESAETIEVKVGGRDSYGALVTAVNPAAPPILQWDTEEFRNPVSWYVWNGGSMPSTFGLDNGLHKLAAICLNPSKWRDEEDCQHQQNTVMLLIEGAKETRMRGIALFPEILKTEFYGVRKVIEAYSLSAKIEGIEEPHACGLILGGPTWGSLLRVTTKGLKTNYILERWD